MNPLLSSPAWMAIYETLAEIMPGGQDAVADAASEVYMALIAIGALKKAAR